MFCHAKDLLWTSAQARSISLQQFPPQIDHVTMYYISPYESICPSPQSRASNGNDPGDQWPLQSPKRSRESVFQPMLFELIDEIS